MHPSLHPTRLKISSLISKRYRHIAALTAVLSSHQLMSQPAKAFSVSASTTTTGKNSMAPPSIRVISNSKLHVSEPDPRWFGNEPNPPVRDPAWTNDNWLKSRFHFSFAEYHSAANSNFGVLRVLNDDLVQPHRGFGTHPHSDMEIVTYIVNGELTHQDSLGTPAEVLGRNAVQFMTAGTGVRHSEFNHGDQPLRFVQTWIVPDANGLQPHYGSCQGQIQKNEWNHLASNVQDKSTSTPVKIHQDVDMYAVELELGKSVVHEMPPGRQGYLLCIEGGLKVNGQPLDRYDACEITSGGGGPLEVEATLVEPTEHGELAHFILFTMAAVPNAGRKDL